MPLLANLRVLLWRDDAVPVITESCEDVRMGDENRVLRGSLFPFTDEYMRNVVGFSPVLG